jgi:hypothetical protein
VDGRKLAGFDHVGIVATDTRQGWLAIKARVGCPRRG